MRLFLMAVGSLAVGFATCHIFDRVALRIAGPRPTPPKGLFGALAAAGYGVCEYFFMPTLRSGYSSPELFYAVLVAGLVGGAFHLAIHSLRLDKTSV